MTIDDIQKPWCRSQWLFIENIMLFYNNIDVILSTYLLPIYEYNMHTIIIHSSIFIILYVNYSTDYIVICIYL